MNGLMQVVDKVEWRCEHCGRSFVRETTLVKHACEQKRRWLDRDKQASRIGYNAWKNYFNTHHPGKKTTEYVHFIASTYYSAFVKFGAYCADISAVNPAAYSTWLVRNRIPIDTWTRDSVYQRYIIDYIRSEDPFDAVRRSVEGLLGLAELEGVQLQDVLRWCNPNKVCWLIAAGKISPWLLYHSSGGQEFISKLNEDQTAVIYDYIEPKQWTIKFRRDAATVAEVQALIKEIGL